jgi:hypothetical protein
VNNANNLTRRGFLTIAAFTWAQFSQSNSFASTKSGLIGHWKLTSDAKDYSGRNNHGQNHGVQFSPLGAKFDGRSNYIEVPNKNLLNFGAGDFSISAHVNLDDEVDDLPGDIISKYDAAARKGFTLSVCNNSGCTNNQANYRNVQFGIDNGRSDLKWVDCGRPGNNLFIWHLLVHEGQLYCSTCEPGANEAGHVYRYEGGTQWADCGNPDVCNAVTSLAVYKGNLYAGASRYGLWGSFLPESPNKNPGGKVYRFEGGSRWVDCGKLGEADGIGCMSVFRGKLYATSMRPPAGVFRYEGGQTWTFCGNSEGRRVAALSAFNGELYGTGWDSGEIYRYRGGTSWEVVGKLVESGQTYALGVYGGKLYASSWPRGEVFRFDGVNNWTPCGRVDDAADKSESMGLAVYNGKFFAGSLPLAKVYRYESGATWTDTGTLDSTPDLWLHRAWSMAVFKGKLFCGTLPSGRIYSLEAGRCATHDNELGPRWRHLAAVRSSNKLKLYVDGKLVSVSSDFRPEDYDISNEKPLIIGFGNQDYFAGRMRDLRVYNRALSEAEILTHGSR